MRSWRVAGVLLGLLIVGCGPDNAPCQDAEPRCPGGYICVKDRVFIMEREVCRKTDATKLGGRCDVDEECEGYSARTAVCQDMQRTCTSRDDPDCDFRCRPVCLFHEQCGPDQICWPGGGDISGVCQEGECGETAVDCPNNTRCLWFKPGASAGVCYAECDVLLQNDCNANPPPVGARCCAPQEACVHFAANPATATCLPVGTGAPGETCDTEQTQGLPACGEGYFCSDQLGCPSGGNCTGTCTQYCRRLGSGGPACDRAGATCKAFTNGTALEWGFCD
ncbi:MAG: hypothetical protein HY904_01450 [Deltaproteobacteria bacterium]|nr:hypothetical protein [Deltaproteobacteria bacterium]